MASAAFVFCMLTIQESHDIIRDLKHLTSKYPSQMVLPVYLSTVPISFVPMMIHNAKRLSHNGFVIVTLSY